MGTEVDRDCEKTAEESIRLLIEGESVRTNSSNSSNQANVTICMVPDTLRKLNQDAYTPRIISIGPLHKEDQHLRAMEEHKVTYMYRLFCRTEQEFREKDIEKITLECVKEVLGLLTRVRACYAPSLTKYGDMKLAEIMVIDGCFILELLCSLLDKIGVRNLESIPCDPIFDYILVLRDIKHDLLLLENQIPFFVLEKLFELTMQRFSESFTLTTLVFSFFNDIDILNNRFITVKEETEDKTKEETEKKTVERCNILGLLHSCYGEETKAKTKEETEEKTVERVHILGLLQSCYRPRATTPGTVPNISYSATEIAGAGVTFKPQTDDNNDLLAVNFKQSSLIPGCTFFGRETYFEIPELCIKDSTPSFLRNLIAYEQCYPLSRHYVTSFVFLMDRLIDTKDDALLLVRSKVIQHKLGAIEDVTKLFNNICSGVVLRDFYYTDEWMKLDDYCKSFWPCIFISLTRIYRSTTWATLTVIGAAILFFLTLLQTIYTV